jgi:hypothetical protein
VPYKKKSNVTPPPKVARVKSHVPGRKMGYRHQEDVRKKIQSTIILTRLKDYIVGKIKMEPAQVTAALGLLKKTLPDLSSIEHTGDITISHEEMLDQLR